MIKQKYLKTESFSYTFSIDLKILKKFIKNGELIATKHFIIPPYAQKKRYFLELLWDVENMSQWLKNENRTILEVDQEIIELLNRRGV